MVKLTKSFSSIKPFTALVIGDFMLDTYTTGKVRRISPEAPVPVMEVLKQESRPGGAGNVVLNLTTLGAKVLAIGRIGNDEAGQELEKLLGVQLLIERGYKTPVKNRLISDSQQLLRIDFETVSPVHAELELQVLSLLEEMIPTVQVIAVSDYGKGFLSPNILNAAIAIARRENIPLIVDPKGIDFRKYRGATVIKPNLSEAYAAAKLSSLTSLDEVAAELLEITEVDRLLITRSEAGISLFENGGARFDFPVHSKEVKDVTGAGDTVLATLCLGIANRLDIDVTVQLANIAAGLAIERLGCVQITLGEIARRLLESDAETKIFEESHTYALHQVLEHRSYNLLALSPGQQMTNALFRSIRELAKTGYDLIVYFRESNPNEELIHLLASLHEVNFIIFEHSLKTLCEKIHPHEIYSLDSGILRKIDPERDLLITLLMQLA